MVWRVAEQWGLQEITAANPTMWRKTYRCSTLHAAKCLVTEHYLHRSASALHYCGQVSGCGDMAPDADMDDCSRRG
jgi:hypothetical protein